MAEHPHLHTVQPNNFAHKEQAGFCLEGQNEETWGLNPDSASSQ